MRCSPRPLAALLLAASLAACTPFRSPEERRDTGGPPPDARGLDAPSADAPTVPLDAPLGMDAPLVTIDTPPAPLDAPPSACVMAGGTDGDGDGFCAGVTLDVDCDDADARVYPRAGDTYGDAVDGDCDGMDCEGRWIDDVYVAACDGSMNWADAAAACVAAGYGGLFEPTTSARDSSFRSLVNAVAGLRYSSHWLGLRRMSGSWSWSSGATLDHTAWSSGEPAGDGDCVHYFGAADSRAFGWNDVPCSISTDTGGAGTFSLSPACMSSTCGNGTVEPGEACDDGNTASGDGCSNACAAESVRSCRERLMLSPGSPSGVYTIDPDGTGPTPSLSVYCDMTSEGGGWTLVAAQFEAFPETNWNRGTTATYDPTLASGRGFALSTAQLPPHTQTGFGRGTSATYVDYANYVYATGDLPVTTVSGIRTGFSYQLHRSAALFFQYGDPERGSSTTCSDSYCDALTLDRTGGAFFSWSFFPDLVPAGLNARGFGLLGDLSTSSEAYAWTLWVR